MSECKCHDELKELVGILTRKLLINESVHPDSDLFNALASLEHQRWSNWMSYLFTRGEMTVGGGFIIEAEAVERWKRLMDIHYRELPLLEQRSDNEEVIKTLRCIGANI